MHIYDNILLNSSWNGNVSDKSCTENQIAHFMFNNIALSCAVYEIMWKNTVGPDRAETTIYL
jgi:hypothetical protein